MKNKGEHNFARNQRSDINLEKFRDACESKTVQTNEGESRKLKLAPVTNNLQSKQKMAVKGGTKTVKAEREKETWSCVLVAANLDYFRCLVNI